jgi:anti-anti-sigma factor
MKVTQIADDGTLLYARCEGPVTQTGLLTHNDLLAEVLGPTYAARKVLLDMERSDFIDSAGVGWLITNHKRFAAGGGVLVLHSLPPRVMHVFQLLSMNRVFNIAANALAARAVALGEMGR